jgi:hypothetical protein
VSLLFDFSRGSEQLGPSSDNIGEQPAAHVDNREVDLGVGMALMPDQVS